MPQTVTAHLDGAQAWMPSRRGDCSRSTAAWPVRFVAADRAAAARPALPFSQRSASPASRSYGPPAAVTAQMESHGAQPP